MTPGANLNLTPGSRCSVWSLATIAVCMTSHTGSLMCSVLSMYPPADSTSHWQLISSGKLSRNAVKNCTVCRRRQSIVPHDRIQLVSYLHTRQNFTVKSNTEYVLSRKDSITFECFLSVVIYCLESSRMPEISTEFTGVGHWVNKSENTFCRNWINCHCNQGRLNQWGHSARAQGPGFFFLRGPNWLWWNKFFTTNYLNTFAKINCKGNCRGVTRGGSVNIAISAIAYLFCCLGPTCSVLLRAAIVWDRAPRGPRGLWFEVLPL